MALHRFRQSRVAVKSTRTRSFAIVLASGREHRRYGALAHSFVGAGVRRASVLGGLPTRSGSSEGTLIGVLATSQAPRTSCCAEVRGPSCCSALPPEDRASVQVLGSIGTATPSGCQRPANPVCHHLRRWRRKAPLWLRVSGYPPLAAATSPSRSASWPRGREKSGCPVRPRKELPVLNIWRRSRKAINRELHALDGNTSTPVAASPMRNVRPRVQVANDDDLDASLAPTVVVPPTPALPVDQFFVLNAQPVLDVADDDDMDALFFCPSAYGERGSVGESVFAWAGAGKHTLSP